MEKVDNTHKIAIIGPADTVSGLSALGVEHFAANDSAAALAQLQNIKNITVDDADSVVYAVVCIIEDLLSGMDQEEYARVTAGALPAVVMLPGPQGSLGYAEARLKKLAEQAVGSAII